jgi:hypothetical protein
MRKLMNRVAIATLVLAALLPVASSAQTPMDELLRRAREALNNLEYERADSIARSLVTATGPGTRAYRTTGLQILAAALYPDEQWAQKPDSARKYLTQLVRLSPDVSMPDGVTWPGLDSLLEDARRRTFAVRLDAAGQDTILGVDGSVRVRVVATRPARFRLVAEPIDLAGTVVHLDSASGRVEMELAIPVFREDVRLLESGRYRLRVIADDPVSDLRTEDLMIATVVAPQLRRVSIPVVLDSTQLLPERSAPRRWRNGAIGMGLGFVTVLAGSVVGSSNELSGLGGDGRAYWMAGALATGAVLGALLDSGASLPENAEYNRGLHRGFAESVRDAQEENRRLRDTYRATVRYEEAGK